MSEAVDLYCCDHLEFAHLNGMVFRTNSTPGRRLNEFIEARERIGAISPHLDTIDWLWIDDFKTGEVESLVRFFDKHRTCEIRETINHRFDVPDDDVADEWCNHGFSGTPCHYPKGHDGPCAKVKQ